MLYIVSTPIGNLGDITLRALEVLKAVDYVASEDTRKTGMMLNHFGFKKPMLAFHEFNEEKALPRMLAILEDGKDIALVTDAGTPSVSDPGYILVRGVIDRGLKVTAIPGASAVVTAVVLSGLPVYSFTFRGFPPHKGGPRKRFIGADKESPYTLVYYESPYRLIAFLKDALEILGDRQVAVANDMTKLFETIYRGKISDVMVELEKEKIRGEYVVVFEGVKKAGHSEE